MHPTNKAKLVTLNLNPDAMLVILNALGWASHDTRLPQGEREMYATLADQLANYPVALEREDNGTDEA